MATPVHITVAGKLDDKGFAVCKAIATAIKEEFEHVTLEFIPMLEADWEEYLRLGGDAARHKLSPLVFYNGINYVGSTEEFLRWAKRVYDIDRQPNTLVLGKAARMELREHLQRSPHHYVYFDIAVGSEAPQRVVFELFAEQCPKTCENFRALCTGDRGASELGARLHYKGSPFHRVVPGGWVQGGDIVSGRGDGGESVFGRHFADECLSVRHDRAGILGMASEGLHTNNSQFYITLAPLPFLDHKRVAFGRVVSGMRALRVMEKLPAVNERPSVPCVVVDCGDYAP